MAIVNCDDDSFYAPSRALGDAAVERALAAEAAGAAVVDFGGESTRPGAAYVDEETEIRRVIPVVAAFRRRSSLPVSVDTRKAAVARAALDAGADIVNDISALEDDPDMAALCAARGAAVALMHKKGVPRDMQAAPVYADVVGEVRAYLRRAAERAGAAGIAADRIIVDPGFGFGKRVDDNFALLGRLDEICALGFPVLAALSRKSFLSAPGGAGPEDRLAATIAANTVAVTLGARMIRVHDVEAGVSVARVVVGAGGRVAGGGLVNRPLRLMPGLA